MEQDPKIILRSFYTNLLPLGRMLSSSKSSYVLKHPTHQVFFNSNIFIENFGKVWYGDIDLDTDIKMLQNVSNEIGYDLYILKESDGKFDSIDVNEYNSKCVYKIVKK